VLPLPFARVRFAGGAPIRVPADATREQLEALREQLERELDRLQAVAEASF
jgi:lysophospholipid acyltransferase (LPLAT)-like uncharacterized protein